MMKKFLFSIFLVLFITCSYAQGINFQGVARSANGTIIASSNVSLRLSIIAKNADALPEYVETKTVLTNAQGIFTIVVGDASNTAVIGSFKNIVWSEGPKFLKVEMDPAGGTNYLNMGSTQLQNVPFSYFSYGVNAANVSGILPITSGGTGASSISALKSNLGIDLVNNVPDIDKPINKATQTAIDTKAPIASPTFTGTVGGITKSMVGLSAVDNTSDLEKPISTLTQAALDSKVSSSTFSNTLNTKVSNETFSATIAVKENAANKSAATDLGAGATSDILFPTQKAVKTYVDAQINSGGVADGGIITAKLADGAITNEKISDGAISWRKLNIAKGDLVGIGMAGSEEIIDYNVGNGISSVTNISQGATRRGGYPYYITTFSISNDGINTAMIQDAAVTNDKIADGISKSKVGLGNVENTSLSTWAGGSNLTSLGTISTGTWSGTTIALNKGGTGATNAADARTNLGLVIGTNVQAPLTAGVDYLSPNGSAANLTSFPTLNQNTTGNAATATKLATARNINGVAFDGSGDITITSDADAGTLTGTTLKSTVTGSSLTSVGTLANLTVTNPISGSITGNAATATLAGNISATTNTTLTSLSNLATVGTITNGVWSGTAVAVEKGGTGLTAAGTSGQVLTSTGSGTLTWTGTHYIGESYGGGKVFYVYDNGKHGLIAATSDQSTGIRWHGGSNTSTRARGDGVGAGLKNTAIIIANQGAVDGNALAATLCNEYSVTVDGVKYGDWYLPSKHELNLLYLQKTVVGSFANNYYWSSTEVESNVAFEQSFFNGDQTVAPKGYANLVRAIRAF
jgi:hypothetical protein